MTIEISECYMLLGSKTKTYHLTWPSVCRFVANLCGFSIGDRWPKCDPKWKSISPALSI